MTDIFAIQDEIGQAISEALKVCLVARTRTVNIEAYQNYLKGQYYYLRLTPESLAKAKEFFEQALAIDTNYAAAYSGLAEYYFHLAGLGLRPVCDMAPMAKSAAESALAIDPGNSVAHSVLGAMAAVFDYDWQVAETHFNKAIPSEPVPPMVRLRYAVNYLVPWRRVPDATEQIRLALESDPLSMPLHLCMAWCLYFAKQYRETVDYARRALEIDANYYLIWNAMGLAQLGGGFTQEAITSLRRVVELAPWFSDGAWYLATAYYQAGDHERSRELAHKLASSHGHTYGPSIYYAASGEADAMFAALEAAHRHRDVDLPFIQMQPLFDHWRGHPRFQALLRQMNLA
jgi:tetratricopeptide (TPR) repeat protein